MPGRIPAKELPPGYRLEPVYELGSRKTKWQPVRPDGSKYEHVFTRRINAANWCYQDAAMQQARKADKGTSAGH